ncbi:MAG: flagellar basal body L-ring protein FlgH [Planctomycetes bacterium]|nr:flagellar basal body L-ring protein FlgH [Planctomycetota bacterium]
MTGLTNNPHLVARFRSDDRRGNAGAVRGRFLGRFGLAVIAILVPAVDGLGQTSSIGKRVAPGDADEPQPREATSQPGSPVIEGASLIAVPVTEPRTFAEHDLITIIVREQKKFEAEADSETRKRWEISSEIEAFVKAMDHGLGAATFVRGKPDIDYEFESRMRGDADTTREDRFTTRITATIVDVKPNGNLTFQARRKIEHDEEVTYMTLTGMARSEDVTPDNTILSTQVADLVISVQNEGSVRDGTRRGWIPKLLDSLRPI